jgi:hypothetical protein
MKLMKIFFHETKKKIDFLDELGAKLNRSDFWTGGGRNLD